MKASFKYQKGEKDPVPVGVCTFPPFKEKRTVLPEGSDPVAEALALQVYRLVVDDDEQQHGVDPNTPIEPIVGSKTGKEVCLAMFGHPEISPSKWSSVLWTIAGDDLHAAWLVSTQDSNKEHKKSGIVYKMIQPKETKQS